MNWQTRLLSEQRLFLEQRLFPEQPSRSQVLFWFCFSLGVAIGFDLLVVRQAFGRAIVVQDDARQHVFWMRRFLDPDLFPQDLIADYFQSVAPWGYTHFYRVFAWIGIDPLLLSKLLPPLLGLGVTVYGFWLSFHWLPMPFTSFLTTLCLNHVIWSHDDIASASPRAFMPVLFLAFLYYLSRRSLLPCCITIALEGLFYPQYVFIFAGILLLYPWRWQQGRLRLCGDRQDYWLCGVGLATAFLVLLPYALQPAEYGPVLNAVQGRQLTELQDNGRSEFFVNDFWRFWVAGERSGVFPTFKPFYIALGACLPLLLWQRDRFPLIQKINPQIRILGIIPIAALLLFFLSHTVLFKLHLPSRYTAYTLRFTLVYATAITLTLLLDRLLHWLHSPPTRRSVLATTLATLFATSSALLLSGTILLYPLLDRTFPKTNYSTGDAPQLYAFLSQQRPDITIASLLEAADDIPTFAQRSILLGKEYAIPYHLGYANPFRQRAIDLIRAQYSLDPAPLIEVMQRYSIDYWLISRDTFYPAFVQSNWIKQYPAATQAAIRNLRQGRPLLAKLRSTCRVFEADGLELLRSDCVKEQLSKRQK